MALMNIRFLSRFRLHRLTKYQDFLFFVSYQEFPIFSVAAPIEVKAFFVSPFLMSEGHFCEKGHL